MKASRRDFLKGMGIAAVAIATPIGAIATAAGEAPESQDFAQTVLDMMEEQAEADFEALCVPWEMIDTDRDIRMQADVYLLRRDRGNERQFVELTVPFEESMSRKQVTKLAGELYP